MVSEKKMISKRLWLSSLLLPALVLSMFGYISFADKFNNVQAESVGSPFIYDNGGLATGATSNSGVSAPVGSQWSEVQNATGNTTESNTTGGVGCAVSTTANAFRCADDFTVPAGQTWTIDQVAVLVYQTGFAGTTSPITGATLRIWNGRPGDSGSTIIFGDTTTNRLGTSTDALLWRIFNSSVPAPGTAPLTNRRIWDTRITVSPAQVLPAGTYWIDWDTRIGTNTAHFAPPVTIPGVRGLPGWNARQFNGTAWVDIIDTGNPATAPDFPQDFPFKLVGSTSGPANTQKPNVDYDGDGKSDISVVRDQTPNFSGMAPINSGEAGRIRQRMLTERKGQNNVPEGSGAGGTNVWYNLNSGNGSAAVTGFGTAATDLIVPADYDGDDKTDVAVWRATSPTTGAFYILDSTTSTAREELFGQEGDNPQIVGDYDGDNKADVATFRCPTAGGQCFFFYRGTNANPGGNITFIPWGSGQPGDLFPYPGDFDGDGKNDFCIQRAAPGNPTAGQFVLLKSADGGVEFINWGLINDFIVPGDYDGDGKSDFMVRRSGSSPYQWYLLERDGGGTGANPILWGITGDVITPGDYDGDGKQDIAIWRPDANPNSNYFYIRRSSDSALQITEWGIQVDVPTANWYVQ